MGRIQGVSFQLPDAIAKSYAARMNESPVLPKDITNQKNSDGPYLLPNSSTAGSPENLDTEDEQVLEAQALQLWDEHKKCEEAIAPVLYALCQKLNAKGKKGEGFKAWLKTHKKPKTTAYRWIRHYCKKTNKELPWPEQHKSKAEDGTSSHVGQGGSALSMKLKDIEQVVFTFLQSLEGNDRAAIADNLIQWIRGHVSDKPKFAVSTTPQQLLKLAKGFVFDGGTLRSSEGVNLNFVTTEPSLIAQCNAAVLRKVITASARFASEHSGYQFLQDGVHLSFEGGEVRGHSGSGSMCFETVCENVHVNKLVDLFIPNPYLFAVAGVGSLPSDNVMIAQSGENIIFSCPPKIVAFKLPIGEFLPTVQSASYPEQVCIVDSKSLREALLKGRKVEYRAMMSTSGSSLMVAAQDPESGSTFECGISANVLSERGFALNAEVILQFLNGASGDVALSSKPHVADKKAPPVLFEAIGRKLALAQITPPTYTGESLPPAV